jgi:hypothetical protein
VVRRGGALFTMLAWLSIIFVGVLIGILANEVGPPIVGCGIKGNLSYNTGERIYHVRGQEYYWQTRINWLKGERWFCSEEDARKAGWRKARR